MTPKKVHLQELLFTVKISPEPDKIGSLATKVYKQLKTEEGLRHSILPIQELQFH